MRAIIILLKSLDIQYELISYLNEDQYKVIAVDFNELKDKIPNFSYKNTINERTLDSSNNYKNQRQIEIEESNKKYYD